MTLGGAAGGAAATLVIKVLADVKDAQKGLGEVGSTVDKAMGAAGSLALPAAAAAGALLGMAKAAGDDAGEAAKLERAIQNAGAAHGDYAKQVDDAIKSSQAKAFTDTETRDAMASLVTATGDVGTATTALATAQDVARAAGVPLAQAADAVAKAQAGSDGALRKLLPGLEKGASATDTLALAQKQAAGQADIYAQSTEGQLATSADAFAELGESIGKSFLPVLNELAGILRTVVGLMTENEGVVRTLAIAVGIVAGAILAANVAIKAFQVVQAAIKVATTIWTGVQWLLNAALSANPISLIVIAIGLLIGAFILAWQNSQEFRDIVTGVFGAVQKVVEQVIGVIGRIFGTLLAILRAPIDAFAPVVKTVFEGLQTIVEAVIKVITGIFNGLAAILTKPLDVFLEAARTVIGAVEGLFKGLADAIGTIIGGISGALKGIGDAINSLPKLPALPFSLAAPAGPGALQLAPAVSTRTARGAARASAPAGGVTVNVYGGDPRRVVQAVREGYRRWIETSGASAPDREW